MSASSASQSASHQPDHSSPQSGGTTDRHVCHHSPSHPSQPVVLIPSESSCWQNLSYSFHPKTRHAKRANAHDAVAEEGLELHKPSFLREAPYEILEIILLHSVRGHLDLRRLALTCTRWRGFATEDQPWKRLAIRAWGNRADIIQVPIPKDAGPGHPTSWREYYQQRISSHLPELRYMISQQNMTVSIRSILINWLLAVIDEFQQEDDDGVFYTGAHHQTVAILDHYCSKVGEMLQTSDLQMIGAACAVLALHEGAALDDIDYTYFSKASFYTDGACTAEEVMLEAQKIVAVLEAPAIPVFETASEYVDVLLTAMQKNYSTSSTYCLAHYLGELSLQAEASLKYSSLIVGASAYALACHTLGWAESIWMPIIRANVQIKSIREIQTCTSELQGLLRQALFVLTRRSKKATLPHVVVKYSRRDKQHVAKVIVTESAWPVMCPHGCDRELNEWCAECEGQPSEVVEQGQQQATMEGEGEEEIVNPEESLNENATDDEQEDDGNDSDVERTAVSEGGGTATGATPRDLAAQRGSAHTPIQHLPEDTVNSSCDGLDGRHLHAGSSSGSAGPSPSSCAVSGASPSPEASGGALHDVSFGVISEGNDNSFNNNVTFESAAAGDDIDRRQSFGSVLGKVFEEDERDEGMMERPDPEGQYDLYDDFNRSASQTCCMSHHAATSAASSVQIQRDLHAVEAAVGDISIESDENA
uniref:Cyclin-F n=1 Tax=Hemiselmis andersenii TaxID=464988 RepID=A0A7S1DGJ7_HEMAN|mmetsp:Transcript_12476/g.30471  ORF Transcript_12476/g.30471 Transcript_12476/m.30471 type:complete len:705 (+) Transcript_12476:297-2411(+)